MTFSKYTFLYIILLFGLLSCNEDDDENTEPSVKIVIDHTNVPIELNFVHLGFTSTEKIKVDWGDGSGGQFEKGEHAAGSFSHFYTLKQKYTITITGNVAEITELTLSKFNNNTYDNDINVTEIDISSLVNLECLTVSKGRLTSLNTSNNTDLSYLNIDSNLITSLDLKENTILNQLEASKNQLASLELSNNKELSYLASSNNQLTSLDITNNVKLRAVFLYNNQLTGLDISNNSMINRLLISDNNITSIDVSNDRSSLDHLDVSNNQLSSLDLSNNGTLDRLDIFGNPELLCVQTIEGYLIRTVNKDDIQELKTDCI